MTSPSHKVHGVEFTYGDIWFYEFWENDRVEKTNIDAGHILVDCQLAVE